MHEHGRHERSDDAAASTAGAAVDPVSRKATSTPGSITWLSASLNIARRVRTSRLPTSAHTSAASIAPSSAGASI